MTHLGPRLTCLFVRPPSFAQCFRRIVTEAAAGTVYIRGAVIIDAAAPAAAAWLLSEPMSTTELPS